MADIPLPALLPPAETTIQLLIGIVFLLAVKYVCHKGKGKRGMYAVALAATETQKPYYGITKQAHNYHKDTQIRQQHELFRQLLYPLWLKFVNILQITCARIRTRMKFSLPLPRKGAIRIHCAFHHKNEGSGPSLENHTLFIIILTKKKLFY
jgi:hypothetical protein